MWWLGVVLRGKGDKSWKVMFRQQQHFCKWQRTSITSSRDASWRLMGSLVTSCGPKRLIESLIFWPWIVSRNQCHQQTDRRKGGSPKTHREIKEDLVNSVAKFNLCILYIHVKNTVSHINLHANYSSWRCVQTREFSANCVAENVGHLSWGRGNSVVQISALTDTLYGSFQEEVTLSGW